MLKLKLQYFGCLMQRTDSLEKIWCWERLKAGGEADDRRWDGCMASPTWWTWVYVNPGVGDGQGGLACCDSGVAKSWTRLSDWTDWGLFLRASHVYYKKPLYSLPLEILNNHLDSQMDFWIFSTEDPLEKGIATHSSIVAWRIPWANKDLDTTEWLSLLNSNLTWKESGK